MENDTGPASAIRGFVRWAITPPQSYAVYFVCLALVAGLSFYAGTLKPKKAAGIGPPPVSAPPTDTRPIRHAHRGGLTWVSR